MIHGYVLQKNLFSIRENPRKPNNGVIQNVIMKGKQKNGLPVRKKKISTENIRPLVFTAANHGEVMIYPMKSLELV